MFRPLIAGKKRKKTTKRKQHYALLLCGITLVAHIHNECCSTNT